MGRPYLLPEKMCYTFNCPVPKSSPKGDPTRVSLGPNDSPSNGMGGPLYKHLGVKTKATYSPDLKKLGGGGGGGGSMHQTWRP